jgi:hypothetical protein
MEHLQLAGTIADDGSFTAQWWRSAPPDAVPNATAGGATRDKWHAVALGAGDAVLAYANASFGAATRCPGGARLSVQALLPLPDDTVAVALRQGTREVYRRAVPPATKIELQQPIGPLLARGAATLPLQIDRSSAAPGAYVAAAWEVPGEPAWPLEVIGVGGSEPPAVRFEAAQLPPGQGQLVVTYFDGVRSRVARSEPAMVPAELARPAQSVARTTYTALEAEPRMPRRDASAEWQPPWRSALMRERDRRF